jgi:hypothetical protein
MEVETKPSWSVAICHVEGVDLNKDVDDINLLFYISAMTCKPGK